MAHLYSWHSVSLTTFPNLACRLLIFAQRNQIGIRLEAYLRAIWSGLEGVDLGLVWSLSFLSSPSTHARGISPKEEGCN